MNTNFSNDNLTFQRKLNHCNSNGNFNMSTEENKMKMAGNSYFQKKIINQPTTREFGRDLTNMMINRQNTTKLNYQQTKLMNFPKKDTLKTQKESTLYNLRPMTATINLKNKNQILMDQAYTQNNFNFDNKENIPSNFMTKTENFNMEVDRDFGYKTNEISSHLNVEGLQIENIFGEKNCMSNVKSNEIYDPQKVPDYIEEIYSYLREVEPRHFTGIDYMKYQRDINEKMRAILIDWLVDVHLKFKLVPETLFLTIQIIDRFLCRKEVNRNKLQLVGITALFIACKYEEIYPPELKDFVYVTDKAYTKKEILKMEKMILLELGFDITYPSSLRFLDLFVQISNSSFDNDYYFFARYLLELFQVDYKSTYYLPSLIAAAALYLTREICKNLNENFQGTNICHISGYSDEKLRDCSKDILLVLDSADTSTLQAVKNKFSM